MSELVIVSRIQTPYQKQVQRLNNYVSVLRLPIILKVVLMLIAAYCAVNYAGIMCTCMSNEVIRDNPLILVLFQARKKYDNFVNLSSILCIIYMQIACACQDATKRSQSHALVVGVTTS